MKVMIFAAAAALAGGLCLGACEPKEIEAPGETSKLEAVRQDAADLAASTGDAMKEGAAQLKEGAQDAGAMLKDVGAEVKEAGSEIREKVKEDKAKTP